MWLPTWMLTRETAPPAAQVRHEHASLREVLAALREADDAALEHVLLENLVVWLAGHFEREEAPGGALARVEEVLPGRSHEVDRLRDEHARMLTVLAQLSRHAPLPHARQGPEAREGVLALVAWLEDHEAREAELLVAAAYVEEGCVD